MKAVLVKLYFVSLLMLVSSVVQAQDLRFIYIQTENRAPFYIRIAGRTISSSSSGYIIIPRLTASSYRCYIGFAKSELAELVVNVVVNEKDAGYLLKNDKDQGWYVVNLNTTMPERIGRYSPAVQYQRIIEGKGEFAKVLAEVVNDSTILETRVYSKSEEAVVGHEGNEVLNNKEIDAEESVIKNMPVVLTDNKVAIVKLGQENTDEGLLVTYLDETDTIKLIIPLNKVPIASENKKKEDSLFVTKSETESDNNVRFIDMELRNPNLQSDSVDLKRSDFVITEKKKRVEESNDTMKEERVGSNTKVAVGECKKAAAERDFLQLRKKMAAEKTETSMQKLALSQFRNICYTTEQIKNLGVLFNTEAERYKFYVTAYLYVLDSENYGKLESQLADSYYITRFKAMIQQ